MLWTLVMFTCVIPHLIGIEVGCSGTIVETLLSCGIWRIPVLSCILSFGLCRGCCVSGTVLLYCDVHWCGWRTADSCDKRGYTSSLLYCNNSTDRDGFVDKLTSLQTRVGTWDFVMDKSGAGAGFLRELRFPLPICIPSCFPQSSSLSPGAGTIGQEWPQCL
jgi:hypothetical protein